MIGESLEFQRKRTQSFRLRRYVMSGQSLHDLRVGPAVTNDGIPCDRFSQYRPTPGRGRCNLVFDATVLIPQLNFQVMDPFAVALKTKVPRFNDSSMNRPNRNFVNGISFNLKKGNPFDLAKGLQPGMSLRSDAMEFIKFSFKIVGLRQLRC